MTKLKVCDISEGASRVERGTLCIHLCVSVCMSGTHPHSLHMCTAGSWLLPEWSMHGPHLVQQ